MPKRNRITFVLVFMLAWASTARAGLPWTGGADAPNSLAPMLERVLPTVVNISTRARLPQRKNPLLNDPFFRRFFDLPEQRPRTRKAQSLGSGVIVDANQGYVITNHHVIERAEEITVTLRDGRALSAEIVGHDPEADVAIIRIEAKGLQALPLGNSDSLRVGDFVVAVGNPFGLGQTVTSGIVSALGRSGLGIEGYEDFIQTDASINPGNSGGPLVNMQGELVGINTAIVGPSGGNVGIGFAIPSNMAGAIMTQLVEHGEVRRGQLGVVVQNLTPDLADAFGLSRQGGAVVANVVPGSAAQKSGLRTGDIITAINGRAVSTSSSLRNAIGVMPIGSRITLDILRDGRRRTLKAVIAESRQAQTDASRVSDRLAGAVLGPIRPEHPLARQVDGVEVLDVVNRSSAWQAGLRKGDIIVSVNRQSVESIDDIQRAVKRSSETLLLNVHRGDGALFLVIR